MITPESLHDLYRASPSAWPGEAEARPEVVIAVLTCMDQRLRPERSLGIPSGSAYVVRNAGGRVTDDALRSLVVASSQLDVKEFVVIQHTGCEMARLTDQQLGEDIARQLDGTASTVDFATIADLRSSVRADVHRIRSSPYVPGEVAVSGFVCNTDTGELEVVDADRLSRIPARVAAPATAAIGPPAAR